MADIFKCILFKWSCTLNRISLKCVLIGPIDNKSVLALNSRQAIDWTNVSQDGWRRVRFAVRLRCHVDKMSPSITGYNQIIPMPNVVRVEAWIVVKLCVWKYRGIITLAPRSNAAIKLSQLEYMYLDYKVTAVCSYVSKLTMKQDLRDIIGNFEWHYLIKWVRQRNVVKI